MAYICVQSKEAEDLVRWVRLSDSTHTYAEVVMRMWKELEALRLKVRSLHEERERFMRDVRP